jgi:ABC-type sugar transport system permease subunit
LTFGFAFFQVGLQLVGQLLQLALLFKLRRFGRSGRRFLLGLPFLSSFSWSLTSLKRL